MTTLDPMDAPAIRWGILGPGGIAKRFAREIPRHTQSRVVAVGSRDPKRAERFVAETMAGDPTVVAHGSYEELVADGNVDAVYVATPHAQHHDAAIMALEAGKPVLVEKSFALSAAQAEEVFQVAGRKRLFAMEAMWSRFLPHYTVMRELIDGGELGEVQALIGCHAQSLNLSPSWRMMNPALGGGALLDLGIYPLSLIHWLWGTPDSLAAHGLLTSTGVDLRETITCRYEDRLALAYTDMEVSARNNFQILGTKARLEVADWFYAPQDMTLTPLDGSPRVIHTSVPGGFQYEAAEVARCLAAGLTESESMSWQSTVEVLRMTDEVRRQLGVVYPGE
ncbi:MAG: Gfo/Idh/MocA family oxidoreductase [Propionibacteriaceae bacterium]|jgi:predicted dehydrogenase|nr:Gfo/Idh/MocA family oxidoreductase [Propionibacteriaceae bacterium]